MCGKRKRYQTFFFTLPSLISNSSNSSSSSNKSTFASSVAALGSAAIVKLLVPATKTKFQKEKKKYKNKPKNTKHTDLDYETGKEKGGNRNLPWITSGFKWSLKKNPNFSDWEILWERLYKINYQVQNNPVQRRRLRSTARNTQVALPKSVWNHECFV